jgi:MFS family permease
LSNETPVGFGLATRLSRKLPFFYGWVIVYVGFMNVFMMGTTTFWGLPVFSHPMQDDVGWSSASIFGALTTRFIVGAFGGLLLGGFADRVGGASRLLLIGLLIDAGSMAALRWAGSPLVFILLYGVIGGAGNTGMRLTMVTLIPKWFIQRRGLAVGYASMGGGMSAFIMVPVVSLLIDWLGWRDAWTALALIMLLAVLPSVPLAIRSPEDIGLHPDGREPPPVAISATGRHAPDRSFTLREVMHSWVFWVLLASIVFGSYSLQTSTIIMVPYFENIGFSSTTAAGAISIYGLFSVAARFIWGFAADKLTVRLALAVQALLTCLGVVFMLQIGGKETLYIAAAYQGVMLGGFPTLSQLIFPEFFGRGHIGSIMGLVQFFSTIIGSSGPLIAGFIFDQTGSYSSALWVVVVTWLCCGLAVYAARPRRESEQTPPLAVTPS